MKAKLFIILSIFLVCPLLARAEELVSEKILDLPPSEVFKAEVVKVIKEAEQSRMNSQKYIQQDVLLKALDGSQKDKQVTYYGIGDMDVMSSVYVKPGDKVFVLASPTMDGSVQYYITDHIRSNKLLFLSIIFVLLILWVGRKQGAKSLIALILSFVIIMGGIIPLILKGYNPVGVAVVGSIFILAAIIYSTWGGTQKAHIALISTTINLIITGIVSYLFTVSTRLSGSANEDIMSLISIGTFMVDFRGLLLAGMILGTVGVLDDVIISQISSVEQLMDSAPQATRLQLIKRSSKIGVDHLSSMTNTLFLAYAGAALPMLLLFYVKQEPFLSFFQIINNEMISTEVVRTLVGNICLTLAVPISTLMAVTFMRRKQNLE